MFRIQFTHAARVQRIAQAVADEVDGQHGDEDRHAREHGPVHGHVHVVTPS
jgi:hypothetical protein